MSLECKLYAYNLVTFHSILKHNLEVYNYLFRVNLPNIPLQHDFIVSGGGYVVTKNL